MSSNSAGDSTHPPPSNCTGDSTPGSLPPATAPISTTPDSALPVRPVWQKQTAKQLKQNNLDADPIFAFIVDNLYPVYREAEMEQKIGGTRESYVKVHLFPIIDKEFDISGPNGYNTGAFILVSLFEFFITLSLKLIPS